MSGTYISAALRRLVIERASGCCEYCRINTEDRAIDFAIDHIIAEKHGGATAAENLCLSCYWCNSYKGSSISSVDWDYDAATIPLFNPRKQRWDAHFRIDGIRIDPITAHGRVTAYLLRFNAIERLQERELLSVLGSFPCQG